MSSYYRIHRASESLSTLLDASRPDGWTCDDEAAATQPLGISCCASQDALRSYIRHYGMSVRAGDVLVRMTGALSGEPDRDQYAERAIVSGYEVVADAIGWVRSEFDVSE